DGGGVLVEAREGGRQTRKDDAERIAGDDGVEGDQHARLGRRGGYVRIGAGALRAVEDGLTAGRRVEAAEADAGGADHAEELLVDAVPRHSVVPAGAALPAAAAAPA